MKAGGTVVAGGMVSLSSEARAGEAGKKPAIRRYRTLGRTGFKVSDIGMGGDIAESNVVRYAYDRGITLFDTAESYGDGDSERKIGEAMRHIDRKKIFLVTKLKIKPEEKEQSILDRFGKCLERLKTGYVDSLFMHSVTRVSTIKHRAYHSAIKKLKAAGKVRYAGLSSHGPRDEKDHSMEEVMLAAVDDGRFDVMLLVYNFMKQEEGEKIFSACQRKNIGAIGMKATAGVIKIEPFDPDNPAGEYAEIMKVLTKRGKSKQEAVGWIRKRIERKKESKKKTGPFLKKHGLKTEEELHKKSLQWALGNADMHSMLVSMPTFDLHDRYIPLSGTRLSHSGHEFLRDYRKAFGGSYCRHACNACASSCPQQLPVGTILRYANYFEFHGRQKLAMQKYRRLAGRDGSLCLGCDGPCAGACPHGVGIQASLMHAHSLLTLA